MNRKKLCSMPRCWNKATLARIGITGTRFYCDDHRADVQEARKKDRAWKQRLKDDYGIIMEEA